jgi:bifunctional non-homologous end joining protein LigD
MTLKKYTKKGKSNVTDEPKGEAKSSRGALKFVIQKHHARQLHYDFRLELDGVLKSWAVPKGPSLDPSVKRLAMMVEDHQLDYRNFEGVIDEGYGAGKVIVWDNGTYRSIETADRKKGDDFLREGLNKGDLKFVLKGKKLKGEFALVKMKNPKMGKNAWLLMKKKDKYASKNDVLKQDESVLSNKKIEEII